MLDLLSKLSGVNSGVGVVTTSGSSSDLFLQLHYCSTFLRNRKRVLIIASHLTESYYRVIFGKLAIRWDPSLISVIELDSIMGDSLRIDEENFVKAFKKKVCYAKFSSCWHYC
ncbi:unnamed protein product [Nippostrongylus brasiliensis]|uniref:Elongator complex protein 6 n=1 Tax=Nippostrongylus brasiliensis TaxID=27835 RepID=A0A0N4XMF4_NIPBR|nr:unnamed protein product [Nippostrongylus brasiliensis]